MNLISLITQAHEINQSLIRLEKIEKAFIKFNQDTEGRDYVSFDSPEFRELHEVFGPIFRVQLKSNLGTKDEIWRRGPSGSIIK